MKYEVLYSRTAFDDLNSAEQELDRCTKKYITQNNKLYRIVSSADMIMSKYSLDETEKLIREIFHKDLKLVTGDMKSVLAENMDVFRRGLSTPEDCTKDFDYITCNNNVRSLTFLHPRKLPSSISISYRVGAILYSDYKEALAAELSNSSAAMRCFAVGTSIFGGFIYIAVLSGSEESARFVARQLLGEDECHLGIEGLDCRWSISEVEIAPTISNPVVDYLSDKRKFGIVKFGNLFIVDDTYGLEAGQDSYTELVKRYEGIL